MAASSAVVGVLGVRFLGDLGGEGALGGQGTRLGGIAAVRMVRNVVSWESLEIRGGFWSFDGHGE